MSADGKENMTPLFCGKTKLVLNLDMEFVFDPWKLIERCELSMLDSFCFSVIFACLCSPRPLLSRLLPIPTPSTQEIMGPGPQVDNRMHLIQLG